PGPACCATQPARPAPEPAARRGNASSREPQHKVEREERREKREEYAFSSLFSRLSSLVQSLTRIRNFPPSQNRGEITCRSPLTLPLLITVEPRYIGSWRVMILYSRVGSGTDSTVSLRRSSRWNALASSARAGCSDLLPKMRNLLPSFTRMPRSINSC